MNKSVPCYEEILVDSEIIVVPSMKDLEKLLADPDYLGLLVYMPGTRKLITALIYFIQEHKNNFTLGLCRVSYPKNNWMAIALFKLNDKWQRVHIEYPECFKCGWKGAIANPTEPSLYFGVPCELEVIQQAHRLPKLGCPRCGSMLDRHAIWVDDAQERGQKIENN